MNIGFSLCGNSNRENSHFTWQSRSRVFLARLHYRKLKKAAITTQCAWRGKVARKELKNLKMVRCGFSLSFFCLIILLVYQINYFLKSNVLRYCFAWKFMQFFINSFSHTGCSRNRSFTRSQKQAREASWGTDMEIAVRETNEGEPFFSFFFIKLTCGFPAFSWDC